jgi:C4-dicarboxylate transporter, DctM subunit
MSAKSNGGVQSLAMRMFSIIAGIVPGVLTVLGYILTIFLILKVKPGWGPKPEKERELTQKAGNGRVWPITLLIVLVLGGLYSGVATPTEISALGALGALVISSVTGRMTRSNMADAMGNTLRTSAMIVTIIFSAHLFGNFIAFTHVTSQMLKWIADSGISPTAVMLLFKTAEIGLVSPPMGLNVFVAAGAAKSNLRSGFIGVTPFIVTELLILGMLIGFPQISLLLVG